MPNLPPVTPASLNSDAIISDGFGSSILILKRDTTVDSAGGRSQSLHDDEDA